MMVEAMNTNKRLITKEMSSIILIVCLGMIVYYNSLFCSFHFDDTASITDNFAIRNLSNLQGIWNFWPCRFISYLSFAFNYHFNRLDVWGYHLFNLGVHLVTAVLVWWLVLLTLSTPVMKDNKIVSQAHLVALLVGLIFISHPIQTEAITYIVQRAASMAAMFYIAALCFYVKARLLQDATLNGVIARNEVTKQSFEEIASSPMAPRNDTAQIIFYICALLTAILAMFTKETAITLPLMILLYEVSFLKTDKIFNWKRVTPFLLTIFIIPLTMLLTKSVNFHEMRRVTEGAPGISSAHYFLTQFRVLVTYIRLLFLPLNQNFDYEYSISKSLFELSTLVSFLFLTSILFFARRMFSRYRLISFSILWFVLTLTPESSVIPIKDVIFEHRLYLPMAGFSIFLVSGAYYFFGKNFFKVMIVTLTLIVAGYSFLTYQRNKIWKNEITLWEDGVSKSPHKARPYASRGAAYYEQGNFALSLADSDKAIALDPNLADAYYNRGLVEYRQGKFLQALSDWNKTIKLNHLYEDAYNNRGMVYDHQGKLAQAVSDYNKAIQINPNHAEAYINRGLVYYELKKYDQAWKDVRQAEALGAAVNSKFINLLIKHHE